MNTAKPPATFSITVAFPTLSAGVSLLVPPVPVPSSRMVPMPRLSAIVALATLVRLTLKVSDPSNGVSLVIGTVTVCVVTPGAKVSVPLVAV